MNLHRPLPDRPASYRDILDAPEGTVAEIVNGVFHMQAQPSPRHQEIASGLTELLRPPFQRGRGGPGGWWVVAEPELHFGDRDYRTLVPDLAGWRRERLTSLPKRWDDLTVVPDWVCEILSPSTARLDRVEKLPVYAEVGIAHVWLIDPAARTLEILALLEGRWTVLAAHGGEGEVVAEPFDAVPLLLGDLWIEEESENAD